VDDGSGFKVRVAVSPGGGRFDPAGLHAFAAAAEGLGFDTIWLSDVPLGPIGDPLVSLTYLAGTTRRLKLGANVVPIGRNPLLLARELAQLDQLSGGRLLLSFVPGLDQPGERRALGYPSGDRGALMEATMGLVRQWWDGKPVEHEDYAGIVVEPRPQQDPLEIWVGGTGPKALERAARAADGWLTAALTPEEAGRGRDTILARAEALGRPIDPEHFGVSIPYARTAVPDAVAEGLRARRKDGSLTDIVPVGAPAIRALVQRHVDVGLSKFVLRPVDAVDPAAELEWLADVVLDLQN
jgi:probable F420-dependent oxidoreductase